MFFFTSTPVHRKNYWSFLLAHWIIGSCLIHSPVAYDKLHLACELLQGSAPRYFLLVNQSITVGFPGQGSQEKKHIPVLRRAFLHSVFLFFFIFLLLSIHNSGQLRMFSATVSHSTFQPRQRGGKIHLKCIFFPLLKNIVRVVVTGIGRREKTQHCKWERRRPEERGQRGGGVVTGGVGGWGGACKIKVVSRL